MTLLDLLPFAVVAVAFWLLILRPARTRRDTQARLLAGLAPGQRVMTSAGIFGTVRAVSDGRVTLEIAPGVEIELVAQAIAEVVPDAQVPDQALADSADPAPADGAGADGLTTDEADPAQLGDDPEPPPSGEAERG